MNGAGAGASRNTGKPIETCFALARLAAVYELAVALVLASHPPAAAMAAIAAVG